MRDSSEKFYKKLLGNAGERKAAKFLKKSGYEIIAENYRNFVGEIDLIVKEKSSGAVVFVEVKTRTGENFGRPAEAVNAKKREKYFKIASEFLASNFGTTDVLSRFDVIEYENGRINHIINAFSM